MSSDDPFSTDDNDRTVIRPVPGGRTPGAVGSQQGSQQGAQTPPNNGAIASQNRPVPPAPSADPYSHSHNPSAARSPLAPSYPSAQRGNEEKLKILQGSGLNTLVDHSYTLFILANQLRNSASQRDIGVLRADLIQQIRLFEDGARASGVTMENTLTARYLLCTFLDENILSTPWGSESNWGAQTLLSTFHNETWGGEKFFLVIEKLKPDAATNIDILEFIYLCLLFGFRGKYGVSEQGAAQLLQIQDELYRTINVQRGEFERELSPAWQGVPDKRNALVKYVPLWVVIAIAGLILLLVYSGFRLIIGTTTEPIYQQIEQLKVEQNNASSINSSN